MDKVFIEALEIETLIGIYDWERKIRQPLQFDIEMGFDNRVPAASDILEDAIDYAAVVVALREQVEAYEGFLLERLTEECAAMLACRFGAHSITVRVSKPMAAEKLGCSRVGISIQRRFD